MIASRRRNKMRILKAAAVSALFIALCGTAGVYAANRVPNVSYGSPEVDGKKDEIYNTMLPIEVKNVINGSAIENPSTGKAWMAWDDGGLYVYVEVNEETRANESPEEYKQDSVEVFTDEDNSKGGAKDSNDTQYRVTSLGSRTYGNAAVGTFKSAAATTDYGYAVEMMLPWLDILPTEGTVVGFDVLINDALGAVRQGMTAWSATTNTNYITTENYGEIRLVFGEGYKPWNGTDTLRISVDGYRLDCGDVQPFVENGRTLVPMRAIFEALNTEVCYNAAEDAVYTIGNNKLIKLVLGSDTAEINGEPKKLDVAARTVNDRTVVPLRFIAEELDADVDYNEYQGIIFIKSKD